MASKLSLEPTPLRTLQRYHHAQLNTFGDGETLVDAIKKRPGFYGPNPIAYLSLMARRPTLNIGDLEEALLNDRSLVRAGAFRKSVFLIATEDYPIYFRALYEILASAGMSRLRSAGIDENDLAVFARRLKEAEIARPETQNNLAELIFPRRTKRPPLDVERLVFRKLCDIGVLVRTSSKGWKGNQFNYEAASSWLEGIDLIHDHPEPSRTETVRRYLRAYGPARIEDVVWWTGLTYTNVRRILDNMGREIVRYPVLDLGEGLVSLRETVDAVRKSQNNNDDGRILFLPLWDAYPLGWRDRTRVVDPQFAPWVYDPAGNTTSVIVEGGRVIGLWQFRDGDAITLEFHVFEPHASRLNALRLAAETHGEALAKVAGAKEVRVVERALPRPLAERPVASFLWPLGKEPVFRITEESFFRNPMDQRGSSQNVLRSKFLDDERLVRPVEKVTRKFRALPDDELDDVKIAPTKAQKATKKKVTKKVAKKKATKKTTKKKAAKKTTKKK